MHMDKKWIMGLVMSLGVLGMSRPVFAADTKATTTVQGEVLDMSCYLDHGAHGDKHKDCADMCIKGGSPMGLLTTDGSVYLLVESHSKKAAYESLKGMAADQVKVTGVQQERGGVKGIVVDSVTKA
jgi:hypothetical protein